MDAGGANSQPEQVQAVIGCALAFTAVFVRFGYLHETLTVLSHTKLYLLYVFAAPAVLAAVLSGGLGRTLRGRPGLYWLGFAAWMGAAIPFSIWRSGSFYSWLNYMKIGPVALLTVAGLTVTWRQCRAMMWAFALACGMSIASGLLFSKQLQGGERTALAFGSINNSNDFAAHLIMLAPFLLWIALSRRLFLVRLAAMAGIAVALGLVVRTASRGAMVALVVDLLVFFWRGTARQRIALCLLAPVALSALLVIVPRDTWRRLNSLSTNDVGVGDLVAAEAAASGSLRWHLLQKSLQYAVQHPIFGVGPGLFALYEGTDEQTLGTHGYYLVAHNSYTQVASECGFPGFLLFVAGILSSLRLLNRTYRKARGRPECEDIRTVAFCVMLSTIGFCTAATFLSLAYTFYLPALAGLSIAIAGAADWEFAARARSALA
jgi:O-antigen ligase